MKKFRQFRPVETREKKSKAGMYLAIFIAVVMVGGIGGIIVSKPADSEYVYGKYPFMSKNNMWVTKINKKEVAFYFLPDQVSHFEVSESAFEIFKNSQGIIFTFDPEINSTTKLQALDIFRFEIVDAIINSYKGKQIGFAATKNTSLYELPVVTCENSSYYFPVMFIDYRNETSIKLINDCIIVSAKDEKNLLGLMDNLKYRIYGVSDEKTI